MKIYKIEGKYKIDAHNRFTGQTIRICRKQSVWAKAAATRIMNAEINREFYGNASGWTIRMYKAVQGDFGDIVWEKVHSTAVS